MMIKFFFPFFACFSKTIDFGSVFSAEMNSACTNTEISIFSQDLQKKAIYPSIFAKPIASRFFSLSAKKLISTNLAIFGVFPSKKHDSVGIRHFCLRFQRKSCKIENNDDNFFFFFFCMFLKNYRFRLSFRCRNEFCMQKYRNKHIFMGFAEKNHLPFHFCKAYSLAIFLVIGQKLYIH